jgi:hypothetical protein
MNAAAYGLAASLSIFLAGACQADDMVAAEQVAGTTIGFVLKGSYSNATLSVAGPNDFQASTFARGGAVVLELSKFGALADGTYNYQLTAAAGGIARVSTGGENGRSSTAKGVAQRAATKSGTFNIKSGKIIDYGVPAQAGNRDRDSH